MKPVSRRKAARQAFDQLVRLSLGGWLCEDGAGASILVWRREKPERKFRVTGNTDGSIVWHELGTRTVGTTVASLVKGAT